jgi:5-(carboxyamino)imidazole ribonucleotide mutase
MGSKSDWKTMRHASLTLKKLKIKHECKIVSAHRTPNRMYQFAKQASKNNTTAIIAGAGGSAHLPGMIASLTEVPVIGVPIDSKKLNGLDSLLSIVQMPKGIPVGTVAIGKAGAINAALFAASIISSFDLTIKKNLILFRKKQTSLVKNKPN